MRKLRWKILVGLILLVIASQFIPLDKPNPPVIAEIKAEAPLMNLLRRSCYDCHSNETAWPWYSRVAPISWMIVYDVHEGREHLNFSLWENLSQNKKEELREESWEEVEEVEMPPTLYVPMHPKARLADKDKALLRAWSLDLESR